MSGVSGDLVRTLADQPGITLAAAKLVTIADFLRTLPMDLPEPGMSSDPTNGPSLMWRVDADTALNIVSLVGGLWSVHTYDEPQTIANTYIGGRPTDPQSLALTVVVAGVNLPDLAVRAVAS